MAPKTVDSWIDGLWNTKWLESFEERDTGESTLTQPQYESIERDWELAEAKTSREGGQLPLGRSTSDISRLAQELQDTSLAPQRPQRSDIKSLGPACASHGSVDLWNDVPGRKEYLDHSAHRVTPSRAVSEPLTLSKIWNSSSSRSPSLQPSDGPYRISWLWPFIMAGDNESTRAASEPVISQLFASSHKNSVDHLDGMPFGLSRHTISAAAVQASPKPPEAPSVFQHRQSTHLFEDFRSSFEFKEYVALPLCIPPNIHHSRRHETLVPNDSISYRSSQSTQNYLTELPAAVVTLRRISIPPTVSCKTEMRSRERSRLTTDILISTSSARAPTPTRFKPPLPPYDLGPAPPAVRIISGQKLHPRYRSEPQSGTIAWLNAIAAFFVAFNCIGINNAFGVFQAFYQTDLLQGTDPSTISWIGSTQICLIFALGVPVSRMVDKGHFRLIFASGTLIMLVGIFSTAWCAHFWNIWLCQGLVTGAGMGMTFGSGIDALVTWFGERRVAIAVAFGAAGSSVGGSIHVVITRHFLTTVGFPTTMRICGSIAAATMILPLVAFRVRGQRHKNARRQARRSAFIQPGPPALMPPRALSFSEPSELLAAAGLFFAFLGFYFGSVYMIPYGSTVVHLSELQATNLLIFMLIASLPGHFLAALISDRCLGPLNTLIPAMFLASAMVWLWIVSASSYASLVVIACFYGFASAGILGLCVPAVCSLCSATDVRFQEVAGPKTLHAITTQERGSTDRLDVRARAIFTCIGVACLCGTPISGALISHRTGRDMTQPFLSAQIFAACCLFMGGILLVASRIVRVGWRP